AIRRVPIQGEGKRQRHILQFQIPNQNVFNIAASGPGRLEADSFGRSHAAITVSYDMANAARGLATEGKHSGPASRDVVSDHDVLSRTINTQPVIITSCL